MPSCRGQERFLLRHLSFAKLEAKVSDLGSKPIVYSLCYEAVSFRVGYRQDVESLYCKPNAHQLYWESLEWLPRETVQTSSDTSEMYVHSHTKKKKRGKKRQEQPSLKHFRTLMHWWKIVSSAGTINHNILRVLFQLSAAMLITVSKINISDV